MARRAKSIPVNNMTDDAATGIAIEKMSIKSLQDFYNPAADDVEEAKQSHRHNAHSFFLVQRGTVSLEIDFKKYKLKAPSIVYLHPNQVHRTTAFKNVVVTSWAINNENLHPEYLKWLEDITPAKPLVLQKETVALFSEALSLCLTFSKRKADALYRASLKDSCNALVALVLSQYIKQNKTAGSLSRFETITKSFKELLEQNYTTGKRPTFYAQKLNISTPYLNECVKNTTGYSVSYHIQQRIVLEAKRLLYHSNKSVKEIATELGYDDYPYFSRLFTKSTGMSALTFRNKNLD